MSELQFKDYFKTLQESKSKEILFKTSQQYFDDIVKLEDYLNDTFKKDDFELFFARGEDISHGVNIINKDILKDSKFIELTNKVSKQKLKPLAESISTDDMLDALQNASSSDKKFDEAIWSWFEDNMQDSGIYAGDATPDDYFEKMSDSQIKSCYNEMSKKFKKVLTESEEELEEAYSYTHTWTKEELIEFISELEDDEVQEVGDFIMGELMEDEEFEDDDFETGSEEEKDVTEAHFFDKNKIKIDREKKINVSQRKMKARLLKKYYKKNRAKIARKAKIYRKKAKRNPSKVFHHKGVSY